MTTLANLGPGVTVHVPTGADLVRTNTYRLRILEVEPVAADPTLAQIYGEVVRCDGQPSRRRSATRMAYVHLAKVIVLAA